MSLQALSDAIDDLPYALSEQVMSYARSLEMAASEIFKDAGIRQTPELTSQLIFISGLRKLFSIVDSNFWIIDNTGAILHHQQQQQDVRVGGTDLSRGGNYYQALQAVRNELVVLLESYQLVNYVQNIPYSKLLRELAHGY